MKEILKERAEQPSFVCESNRFYYHALIKYAQKTAVLSHICLKHIDGVSASFVSV